ncbi:MAG: hypothetical protein C0610_11005 [Desulfobacteraceae bacterium]|nr:MAG: hypothetical protein C0610_11005 [Desulfobacteraceae bacterium]
MKYTIHYGCYLGMDEQEVEANSEEEASMMAYELAIEATEGWLGMHGFYCDCSVEDEDCSWSMIQTWGDCCRETIEHAAEYWAEEAE